ncbi:MAG TPA: hypothetical protein VMA36_09775 [Candidatus Limnocylindria bacterium]|nr:hypothetical protein [Candidatus Limnocylindria bacterium]
MPSAEFKKKAGEVFNYLAATGTTVSGVANILTAASRLSSIGGWIGFASGAARLTGLALRDSGEHDAHAAGRAADAEFREIQDAVKGHNERVRRNPADAMERGEAFPLPLTKGDIVELPEGATGRTIAYGPNNEKLAQDLGHGRYAKVPTPAQTIDMTPVRQPAPPSPPALPVPPPPRRNPPNPDLERVAAAVRAHNDAPGRSGSPIPRPTELTAWSGERGHEGTVVVLGRTAHGTPDDDAPVLAVHGGSGRYTALTAAQAPRFPFNDAQIEQLTPAQRGQFAIGSQPAAVSRSRTPSLQRSPASRT